MRFLEAVAAHAAKQPQALALRNSEGEQLAYAELWAASGAVASALIARVSAAQDAPHAPVLVYGHKSPLMLASLIACMRAGRAYVPVDRYSVPAERVASIASQLGHPLILAVEPLPEIPDLPTRDILSTAALNNIIVQGGEPDPTAQIAGEDLCYILFTSGSTGAPKGVEVTASCVDNFCAWDIALARGAAEPGAVWLDQAPFSFDLSVFELVGALATGGTLYSVTHTTQQHAAAQLEALAGSDAAVWVSTPSFADLCLADHSFNASLMPSLRLFLFCGETLANGCARALMERFPAARVLNTYGPTESTVAVTAVEVTPAMAASAEPLPVGSPRPGTRLHVVDVEGRDLPANVLGEVIIEGDTVALGYYGRPDLTARAFGMAESAVAASFDCAASLAAPARTYRTGDEGWLDDAGMLHYRGRLDLQVKLNGYRIELGEIEEQLRRLPGVDAAAVTCAERDGRVAHLVAHVVYSGDRATGESDFRLGLALKDQLKSVLPHYMVPRRIEFLRVLPRTGNGKVDRRALTARTTRTAARDRFVLM